MSPTRGANRNPIALHFYLSLAGKRLGSWYVRHCKQLYKHLHLSLRLSLSICYLFRLASCCGFVHTNRHPSELGISIDAEGSKDISPWFSKFIAYPLFFIWRKFVNEDIVPNNCKLGNIIPIHKGKSQAIAKNYRPVALTSLLVKTFEN